MSFRVIKGKSESIARNECILVCDDKVNKYMDYIMVGISDKGALTLAHNCDPIFMATALELVKDAFIDMFSKLPKHEQEIVLEYINTCTNE
jgi:hypothetical protein